MQVCPLPTVARQQGDGLGLASGLHGAAPVDLRLAPLCLRLRPISPAHPTMRYCQVLQGLFQRFFLLHIGNHAACLPVITGGRTRSGTERDSSVTEQRRKTCPIQTQTATIARAVASTCGDERGRFGLVSRQDRKTQALN